MSYLTLHMGPLPPTKMALPVIAGSFWAQETFISHWNSVLQYVSPEPAK